jgi:hypothetical protein
MAAKAIGLKEVPVDYQDYESPAVELADMLADNRIAELAEPEMPALKDLLLDLDTGDLDMDITGFDATALEGLMTQFRPPDWSGGGGVTQDDINARKALSDKRFAVYNRAELDNMITLVCPECGKEYQVKASDVLKEAKEATLT